MAATVLSSVGITCTGYCDLALWRQLPSDIQWFVVHSADGMSTITYQERVESVYVDSRHLFIWECFIVSTTSCGITCIAWILSLR